MKIDKQTLEKVAHLARVEVPEGMEGQMIADLEKILTWVAKLNEVDTAEVEPLTHMSFEQNVLRPDEPRNTLTREQGLANAPQQDGTHFQVPKVLDTQNSNKCCTQPPRERRRSGWPFSWQSPDSLPTST